MNEARLCQHCGKESMILFFVNSWPCDHCGKRNGEVLDFDADFAALRLQGQVNAEYARIKADRRKPYKRFGRRS